MLLAHAGSILEADERLRARLRRTAIADAVALVPRAWFAGADPPGVYVEYLTRRLAAGEFAQEAEHAHDHDF